MLNTIQSLHLSARLDAALFTELELQILPSVPAIYSFSDLSIILIRLRRALQLLSESAESEANEVAVASDVDATPVIGDGVELEDSATGDVWLKPCAALVVDGALEAELVTGADEETDEELMAADDAGDVVDDSLGPHCRLPDSFPQISSNEND